MYQHPTRPLPEEDGRGLDGPGRPRPGRDCAEAAYAAFCAGHRALYAQFAAAVTGSAPAGRHLTQAAFHKLAVRWPAALRSASPPGFAWTLLSDTVAPFRTGHAQALCRVLCAAEADALILRYRLGYSPAAAGGAMGMSPCAFELLRNRALAKAAGRHMPLSDAV